MPLGRAPRRNEPNTVWQTCNREAEARTNPNARKYPAIGSLCAKFRGANHPEMPPYVAFKRSDTHLAFGGFLLAQRSLDRKDQRTDPIENPSSAWYAAQRRQLFDLHRGSQVDPTRRSEQIVDH